MLKKLTKKAKKIIFRLIWINKFGKFGKNSYLNAPLRINNSQNIFIGNNVTIQYKAWLAAKPINEKSSSKLIIKDGCNIGDFNHIYATKMILIEECVLTASRVYITDNLHSYEDILTPISKQPVKQLSPVRVGAHSWLGENVCVIGVNIGKHCVIGANSVVTKDIPDYSVAVGIPAHIIKRYNFETQQWEKTAPDGTFVILE